MCKKYYAKRILRVGKQIKINELNKNIIKYDFMKFQTKHISRSALADMMSFIILCTL